MCDTVSFDAVKRALEANGLLLRGGFHPEPDDGVPAAAATLLLVGNAGRAMWRRFSALPGRGRDPLNEWTREVLSDVAMRFGGTAIFPFEGPPYAPFHAWAKRAEPVHDSPIGMLIHPDYGLWHAWRGALAFTTRLDLPPRREAPSPCESCASRPCLSACPVGAFRDGTYDVPVCSGHLRTPEGVDCMDEGCRARRACPVGKDYVYQPAQAAFHMAAFLRNRPS